MVKKEKVQKAKKAETGKAFWKGKKEITAKETKQVKKEKKVNATKEKQKVDKPKKQTGKEKQQSTKKAGVYSKLQSIKGKVMLLVVSGIVIAVGITLVVLMNYMQELVIDSAYGKMLNTISSYGKIIDVAEEEIQVEDSISTKKNVLTAEQYEEILQDMNVEGVDSFYYYVIDKNGIILYHTDDAKIGKPNTNRVIATLLGNLNKGVVPDSLCAEFEEDGVTQYASYYVTGIKSVVIVCADGDELMKPIRELISIAFIVTLIILAVAIALTNVIVGRISKPIWQISNIINDTAKLKLRVPENMNKLCSRKDETGMMSRAVQEMSGNLHEIVCKIEQANDSIKSNMGRLEDSSNRVHILCTDNSATTQQLAASTEEVTSMTQVMNEHMLKMREQSERIGKETEESNKASEEIAGRARNMQNSTTEAIARTKEMYQQIKDKTETAMDGLQSVSKINELTGAIVEISDQTSLLSLNASIEAARAGEAGKGFGVVASEISKLAKRSLDTVDDINSIIVEVNRAVANISSSLEETTVFLEENVLTDYDSFKQISEQYQRDADTFKNGMSNISAEVEQLNSSLESVTEAVENIRFTIEETSIGVNDIAEKTSNVVKVTSDNYELTNNTVGSVSELEAIIDKFEFD